MRAFFTAAFLAIVAPLVSAENIFIQVGGNATAGDNTTVFSPQRVVAQSGDIVFFNFTAGNHSATQSTFADPCIPAHDTNITINGFDSDFRPTNNGTAVTVFSVPITDLNVNTTFWFYDKSPGACGSGAVGSINDNEGGNETLAGFIRNAERLNGSATATSFTPSQTASVPVVSGSSGSSSTSSGALQLSALADMGITGTLGLLGLAFGLVAV